MKTRLEWFIVPCVASMFAGNAISLHAQDAPKAKRNLNVVLTKAGDDHDAKSIRDKVAKELEKSGVSEEIKTKILKEVEAALSGVAKDIAKKTMKATAKNSGSEDATVVILGNSEDSDDKKGTGQVFTTKLFMDPKGESFRIGIQCIQIDDKEAVDGDDTKPGLEVKAVFDDSPASKAGIKEGDLLLTVDATKITKISELTNALQAAGKKEAEVAIEVKRDDKTVLLKVKPKKMKSADLELEDIKLALPTGGYVFDEQSIKSLGEQMKNLNPAMAQVGAQVFRMREGSDDLKKDMEDLKSELAEMKKLLREIAKTMGEKK